MPFRRRFKRPTFSKRRFGRRFGMRRRFNRKRPISRYTNRITRMTVQPTIITDKTFVKLVKSTPFTLQLPADDTTTFDSFDILGNGFLNTAGSASQLEDLDAPAGLQIWSQFYENYRVLGSKVSISFNNILATDLALNSIVGVLPRKDITTPLTSGDVVDQVYSKWRLSRTTGVVKINSMMKTQKMFGQKVTQEEDFQGNMSYDDTTNALAVANPAVPWYWTVYLSGSASSGGLNLPGFLTVTYYVQLEDRIGIISKVPAVPEP